MNTNPPFLPGGRDPAPLLGETLRSWGGGDAWIFGYASLIWRPEFDSVEDRPATVYGWHRSLAMRSRVNRGTPECPGLVFALVQGGSCRGRAYRIEGARVEGELRRLWDREMPNGIYDPKWLPCRTPQGVVRALAFTLDRRTRATPAGSTTSRWSRSCAPPTAASAAPSPTSWRQRRRCATAASATATSSAWSSWPGATPSPPSGLSTREGCANGP